MAGLDLKGLIGKLNPVCQRALEGAAGLCLSRTNYNVEIEHWLVKLLEQPGNDICLLLKHFDIDQARVLGDLTKAIDRLKTGNSRPPLLSPEVCDLIKQAWLLASVDFGDEKVRGAWLLLALLSDESISRRALAASDEFRRLAPDVLRREASRVFPRSTESDFMPGGAASGDAGAAGGEAGPGDGKPRGPTKTPNLDQYTIDLTGRAKAGTIDPVRGREAEVRQIVDILTRRRQNNPILTGEAGVGKTAVVEGFAQRIADGDVPEPLKNVSLRTLDLSLLQAGAGVKGEFENRLKGVIDEVKKSPVPIILFIDEAHTLIGAGGQAGQGDAANMLKPALARGELRTIAATTWAEYKKYFEKDAALARRFQVVKVEEPDRRDGLPDAPRHGRHAREAPQGVGARRGRGRGRQALAAVHSRPAAPRQGREPARYGLREGGDRPGGRRRRRSRTRGGRSMRSPSRSRSSSGNRRPAADHAATIAEREAKKGEIAGKLAALEARFAEESKLVEEIRAERATLMAGVQPRRKVPPRCRRLSRRRCVRSSWASSSSSRRCRGRSRSSARVWTVRRSPR
jgi:type VI secretion system protein VasG